jgi:Lon protease-like protein
VEEIGLFPLGIVLLPTEFVPLHIFEPRYRELIGECLEHEGEFGLVHTDGDVLQPIGTLARVADVIQRYDDGRLDVVVEGGGRFRLVELTQGRSFQTARIEELEDRDDPASLVVAEEALEAYGQLLALAGASADVPEVTHPQLSYALAGRFELASELKLELLVATSERARLSRVVEILEGAAAAIERQRELGAVASTNGKARDVH